PAQPDGDWAPFVAHDAYLVSRKGPSGRARPRVTRTVRDEDVADLGGADAIDDLDAEASPPAVVELFRQRLAGRHAETQGRRVEALLGVLHRQHRGEERRDTEEERRPIARDGLEHALRGGTLGIEHRLRADAHRKKAQ